MCAGTPHVDGRRGCGASNTRPWPAVQEESCESLTSCAGVGVAIMPASPVRSLLPTGFDDNGFSVLAESIAAWLRPSVRLSVCHGRIDRKPAAAAAVPGRDSRIDQFTHRLNSLLSALVSVKYTQISKNLTLLSF